MSTIKTYDRFENALEGKTQRIGGMNVEEFRNYLYRLYPVFRHVVKNLRTRSDLINFYKWRQSSPTKGEYKSRSIDYNGNIFKLAATMLNSRKYDWCLDAGKYVGITSIDDSPYLINTKRNLNRLYDAIWTDRGNWRRNPNDRTIEAISSYFRPLYYFILNFETYADLMATYKQLLRAHLQWSHLSVRPLKRQIVVTCFEKSLYIDCRKCVKKPLEPNYAYVRGTYAQYTNGHPEAKAWYREWLEHTGAPNRIYTRDFVRHK